MRVTLTCILVILCGAACAESGRDARNADAFLVVDCLLPSQIRRLGSMTYAAARKAIKTSTSECEARGGEYVAYDRASAATTLKVWLPLAQEGDPEAQTYVGETYEKGFGAEPDYAAAASWYLKAAEQGYSRAAINLGNLFEQGLGLEKDPEMARFWYREASRSSAAGVEDEPSASITLVEPVLGVRGVSVEPTAGKPILVIGNVESEVPIVSVTVNREDARLVQGQMFRASVTPTDGMIEVVAKNARGEAVTRNFRLDATVEERADSDVTDLDGGLRAASGDYYALVIGNDDYSALPDLGTAVKDARSVADVLRRAYGFSVELLVDADRYEVLSALNDFRTNLEPDDRLLVYYAGHGELDRINRRGHWLPVDAEPDNPANWISNISITDLLNIIPARQLMVIADSCYSGMMSRSALQLVEEDLDEHENAVKRIAGSRTRTAFTSGGVAPVLDGAGGEHSVFAAQLLVALRRNEGAMTGIELFEAVAPEVEERSRRVGFSQSPEYAPLKFAGHEAGDFVFLRTDR